MATFDQLPAEQRAIIELVVQRGRSYDDLADILGMPTSRIRELAREALSDLSPVTADKVDPDWRGQLADYVLGQQSGPESTATQGHLRRSEPARVWAFSLLDSLDTLYGNGDRPSIPAGEAGARVREREPRRREREREVVRDRERGAPLRGASPLSPAARSALFRRRLIGGAVALIAVVALVWLIFLRGDDEDNGESDRAGDTQQQQQGQGANAGGQPEILGQIELQPQDGADASGFAFIGRSGQDPVLIVQGKVPRIGETEAYEVWLYNDQDDAVSLGAQRPDERGNFSGAGPLPDNFDKYRYIDVTRERVDRPDEEHSGVVLLRGETESLQPVGGQGGQGGGGGGGAAPPPEAP